MCFSAPASFMAAGVTGVIGLGCLMQARSARDWPLAAMPLLFSMQQTIEGLLWLSLPVSPQGPEASFLTIGFLLYAKVLWPVYTPVTVLMIEPDPRRRGLLWLPVGAGVAAGLHFLRAIATGDHHAAIVGGHIAYETESTVSLPVATAYLAATCVAPLLSSHVAVRLMGCIVIAGAWITYVHYWQTFSSVWCYFAAAASVVLLVHFMRESRLHRASQAP